MTTAPSTPRGIPAAAGVLLLDDHERVLLVNPTYKSGWEIPGGMVEEDEAPRAAARREVDEELGLDIEPQRLLSLDYRRANPSRSIDVLRFVFWGGTLAEDDAVRIQLQVEELSEWRFFTLEQARENLPSDLGLVVSGCIEALGTGETRYLEH